MRLLPAGTGSFHQLKLWRHSGHRWGCRLIRLITLALCLSVHLPPPHYYYYYLTLQLACSNERKVWSELYYDCWGNDQPLLRTIVCHHMNDHHYNITSNYAPFSQLLRSLQIIAELNAEPSDPFVSWFLKLKGWGQRIIVRTSPLCQCHHRAASTSHPQTGIKL